MASHLFSPLLLRKLELRNRVIVAPMCQYLAQSGQMTNWHIAHLSSLALSGAGLLIVEATAVRPDGRISPSDVGLYDDPTEAAMGRVMQLLRNVSKIPLGIQLAHAGRKASTRAPWEGRGGVPEAEGGWQVIAPSALPFKTEDWMMPRAMSQADLNDVVEAFIAAAKRAERLGFDYAEVHCAHGYLLSTFLSPLSNRREDEYGGDIENRMRFPLEVVRQVRSVWPENKPLGIKINGSDFTEGGWTMEDAGRFAIELEKEGIDLITVSGGGVDPRQQIQSEPGYQVPLAEHVHRVSGVATVAVGMILSPEQAEEIVASGKADAVALARAMLFNPRWPYHAAHVLGAEHAYPLQYERAHPDVWPGARYFVRLK